MKYYSKAYSLGVLRDDGDFHILATLNNNDELVSEGVFEKMRTTLVAQLSKNLGESVYAYPRQDTPDYINLHEDDTE